MQPGIRAAALVALTLVVASAAPAGACCADWSVGSGARSVQLIELYTSQGCSSCPPAEAWLGRLRADDGLWRERVPLNFHVDYWDGLGWPDRYATPGFTQRQYQHVRELGLRSAATPAFFVDGAEWRGYFRRGELPRPGAEAPGKLQLTLRDGIVRVRFDATAGTPDALEVHAAILGVGLRDVIEAGENRGRALRQDFVVLGHDVRPLEAASSEDPADGSRAYRARLPLPRPIEASPQRWALVAWVSRANDPRPVQATGGWLPASLAPRAGPPPGGADETTAR